jgi:hypothetical protein
VTANLFILPFSSCACPCSLRNHIDYFQGSGESQLRSSIGRAIQTGFLFPPLPIGDCPMAANPLPLAVVDRPQTDGSIPIIRLNSVPIIRLRGALVGPRLVARKWELWRNGLYFYDILTHIQHPMIHRTLGCRTYVHVYWSMPLAWQPVTPREFE